jgi:HK97 family phage major capsid protein
VLKIKNKETTMLTNPNDLKRERTLKFREAERVLDKVEAEQRDLTKPEREQVDSLQAEVRSLDIQISKVEAQNRMEMSGARAIGDSRGNTGQQFVESEEYRNMIKKGIWNSDPVQYRDIIASKLGDVTYGVPVAPEIVPGIIGVPQQPLRIRDLLPMGRTSSNSIAFVRETLFTNLAAVVKESIEGSEHEKPESVKQFESCVVQVQTLAHWIPATRQIVEDAPALQSFINAQLIYGLKVVEDWELLHGEGDGHLVGICPLATPYDSSLPAQLDVTNPTRLDDIRAASYQVEQALYSADGVVLNPFDWAAIELVKEVATGKYVWVSVSEGGVSRTWRLPVVISHNMPVGHFLVGAFKFGAQLWDREESNIRIAEQHADFFIKNLVAILAEERLALAVYCPQAFVYGEFEEYGS